MKYSQLVIKYSLNKTSLFLPELSASYIYLGGLTLT